jgi:hypothetical protein
VTNAYGTDSETKTIIASAVSSYNSSGGGGGGSSVAPNNSIVFSGRAYPGSKVTILKNSQFIGSTISDAGADFNVTISGLSEGDYNFGIYSEDSYGVKSSVLNFPVKFTNNFSVKIDNIFISPTISVDKSEVKKGDNVVIFGQTTPSGDVNIVVNSDSPVYLKTVADNKGVYLYNLDTSILEEGQHHTKSKTLLDGTISSYSEEIGFVVGDENILSSSKLSLKGDLNNDGRVNLVDFSIAAYWYKKSTPLLGADLNGDGQVNLIDFSIMVFYWTD